ncbi:uncharacterized protein B0T15DRAFT_575186 [Chaetomium strumarium]|uniref:Uncharacterized protein n=1 Tax=Chaetomium strumarium TaxID=1170767 RepID=A0AAJ0GTL0_9PEZI|nr:hypothetical protein B0T15DRAFT_575186 [Chaetomium strumarium]
MAHAGFTPPQNLPEPPRPTAPTLEERMAELFHCQPTYSSLGPPPESDLFNLLFPDSPGKTARSTPKALELPAPLKAAVRSLGDKILTINNCITTLLADNSQIHRLELPLRMYQHRAKSLDNAQLVEEIKILRRGTQAVADAVATIRDLRNETNEVSERLRNIEHLAENVSAAGKVVSGAALELYEIAKATQRNKRIIQRTGDALVDVLDYVFPRGY